MAQTLFILNASERFDGHGECFIEIGGGKAGLGGGDLYTEPKPHHRKTRAWTALAPREIYRREVVAVAQDVGRRGDG